MKQREMKMKQKKENESKNKNNEEIVGSNGIVLEGDNHFLNNLVNTEEDEEEEEA